MTGNVGDGWVCVGEGRHRMVWWRPGSDFIIKVPKSQYGLDDNMLEHYRYRRGRKDYNLAACRMLSSGCLLMRRVTHIGFSSEADWTWSVDCGQVGYTSDMRLVVYDYGS